MTMITLPLPPSNFSKVLSSGWNQPANREKQLKEDPSNCKTRLKITMAYPLSYRISLRQNYSMGVSQQQPRSPVHESGIQ